MLHYLSPELARLFLVAVVVCAPDVIPDYIALFLAHITPSTPCQDICSVYLSDYSHQLWNRLSDRAVQALTSL
jgi:hypothetical protein